MESGGLDARELIDRIAEGFATVRLVGDPPADFIWVSANPALAAMMGRPREAIIGKTGADLVTGDLRHLVEAFARVATSGEPARLEHRFGDPENIWAVHAFPLGDGTVGVLHTDVTKERRAQQALIESEANLRDSEARFREIADQAPFPMWVTALDRTRSFVNKAYMAFICTDEETAKAFDWRAIIHPEDQARLVAESIAGEASLRPFMLEGRYKGANGQWIWLRSESNPRFDAAGNLTGFIGAAFDVTIAKEAQLRLEELVAERSAELASAQAALRQSQKLESMGQLTGGVAHDFNNLLTPIVGALDVLQRHGLNDQRLDRLVGGAQQSAERARVLVQRLLAFARRQPLKPVPVDLAHLIHEMRELLTSTIGPRVILDVNLEPGLPCVLADPNQLEMAILNLGVNARDAMPEGGLLEVHAKRLTADDLHAAGLNGDYVRLCVSDTGIGMDEDTRARAIEPFFSTKGVGRGTGLGLSMAHGLAAQQGGRLEIDSAPGEGTRILLFLPATTEAATIVPTAVARQNDGAGRILLVDDEPLVRAATADMLVDLGYHVIEAESAEAALLLLDAGTLVDALVTDHLMPGMSGTELAQMVAARSPPLPALIISGFAEVGGLAPALPSLSKPFRRDDLAAALAELIPGD
ncbi:MAG TPA: ATP-binding protein [Sphingomonas sp.]|nr:ATP-binding protein [Sphingomonas sp.]